MTPCERKLRIERAQELLEGTLPIAQIARRVGYASHPRFGVMFRRLTGMSPRDYRLRARAGESRSARAARRGS